MALTYTDKFNLPVWTSGADSPMRTLFNAMSQALESAVFDSQGAGLGSRPNAGKTGRHYTDTNTGYTYRDNGTAWVPVNGIDQVVTNSVTGKVPLTVLGIAGSGHLQDWTKRSGSDTLTIGYIDSTNKLRLLTTTTAKDNSTSKNYVQADGLNRQLVIQRQAISTNESVGPMISLISNDMSASDLAIRLLVDGSTRFSVGSDGSIVSAGDLELAYNDGIASIGNFPSRQAVSDAIGSSRNGAIASLGGRSNQDYFPSLVMYRQRADGGRGWANYGKGLAHLQSGEESVNVGNNGASKTVTFREEFDFLPTVTATPNGGGYNQRVFIEDKGTTFVKFRVTKDYDTSSPVPISFNWIAVLPHFKN